MKSLFDKINTLKNIVGISKHDSIVRAVKDTIDEGMLTLGTYLPSVNHMVKETEFARKTIVKAYSELREKGIIESKNRLGYYVVSENTNQEMRIALLLYAFHTFQEIFYNTFRASLPDSIKLDVFFHHNNLEVFESIIKTVSSRYKKYVIAPIPHPKTAEILSEIPQDKLMLVDRFYDLGEPCAHVTQEFEQSLYSALVELEPIIKAYDQFILFFKDDSDYPMEVLNGFKRFCNDYKINGIVHHHYDSKHLQKGVVYCTIGDHDLWGILKDAKNNQWEIGKDIGILSHNDTPVKEIISGGITTFSTDFELMAKKAASCILKREMIQETIPSILIRRNSL